MNKTVYIKTCAAAALTATALAAYGADLKVGIDRSHDLWWNAPERPVINLTITDTLDKTPKSTLRVQTVRDTLRTETIFDRTFSVEGEKSLVIALPITDPGFYKVTIQDDGNTVEERWIGYEPTNVVSLPDSRPDFQQFWAKAKAELAEVPANVRLTPAPEMSGKKRDAFRCTFQSWGGDTIDAVVLIPNTPGTYPAQVYYNGYGGKPWDFDPDSRPDWVEMMTSVRGQFYSEPRNRYGDWIRYHIDDPSTYYYKGAYLDAVRALDVLENLPYVDRSRLYAEGGSQGEPSHWQPPPSATAD